MTESPSRLRVVIAEDHQMVREGMRLMLALEQDIDVVGEAKDGESAVRVALEQRPDVLILDYVLPGFDGAEVLRRLRAQIPEIRILFVTGCLVTDPSERDIIQNALACGGDGYVLKQSGNDELLFALRSVAQGGAYVSPAIANAFEVPQRPPASHPLTQREVQILTLIAGGQRNQDIADRLSISLLTVRKHRENLMRKLDLHNSAELTAFAIKQGKFL